MELKEIFPSFSVDIEGIVDIIEREGYEKVLFQGPEGMKRGLVPLANFIQERTSATVWIDGEHCYGACDHAGERAKLLGAEALIHLGHADIPSMGNDGSVPIHFFHAEMRTNSDVFRRILEAMVDRIPEGRAALFTTVQHLDLLPMAGEVLETFGRNIHIGEPGERESFPGQVLGCSFHPAKDLPKDVTSLLFIGTGRFHPLGLCLESGKEVLTLDPITGDIGKITKEDLDRILRVRYGQITRAKELMEEEETVGIVVGFKPGQRRVPLSEELVYLLEIKGKNGKVVLLDHMDPMKLRSLGFKIAVSTSCPRIAIDDSRRYSAEGVTLLTPVELRIALDEVSWDDYRFDYEW